MQLGLSGRRALVTGASSGLGYAVAAELAREGADVIICSRDAGRSADAAARLDALGAGTVTGVCADMRSPADRRDVVDRAMDRFGGVDILVSNSGGPPSGIFEEHPEGRWLETVDEHLGAIVSLVHGVLPGMRERRWGRILAITSIAVKQPIAGLILSNTARAAVAGFARTLANEVAADNVTVNNVMPGYTLTARVEQLSARIAAAEGRTAEDVTAGWAREIPMARLGTPEEFAALVAFLASERAGYITGTSIPVDGGWIRALL